MRVYLVFPAKPENFAYGPYLTMRDAAADPAMKGVPIRVHMVKVGVMGGAAVIKVLEDVKCWTYAERYKWFMDLGVRVINKDGTFWTEEDWFKEHPDTEDIDRQIWPRRVSSI